MNRQRGVVVELVGPAGAGKTTLAQGVSAVDPTVRSGLTLWGLPRPKLLEAVIPLIPTFLTAAVRPSRRLQWEEMAQMIRLGALRRIVDDEARKHRVIILDEGPVFALSWIDFYFARNGDRAPAWRRRAISDWASLLDVVVFIDASDSTLAQRIRTREKDHLVKNSSDEEIYGFAAGFRKAFDRVIAEISRAGHLVVDALRTDDSAQRENTDRLMTTLLQRRNGN
ncbi:MAG TPA: hypothetical protein VL549_08350 [Gemmatimonadales bacterium]|jgi:thymidylate kinase|nr:hypothetical protein [Gemmatimonadales bacterium]